VHPYRAGSQILARDASCTDAGGIRYRRIARNMTETSVFVPIFEIHLPRYFANTRQTLIDFPFRLCYNLISGNCISTNFILPPFLFPESKGGDGTGEIISNVKLNPHLTIFDRARIDKPCFPLLRGMQHNFHPCQVERFVIATWE
jgi:hypothetical protein